MELVSPKALLASLLGILFVIAKAMTVDGIHDLLWMVAFGYFTIKGLTIAFSQKAHDEDVKEAYRRKVLYRNLFGKFAYIAADIPVIASSWPVCWHRFSLLQQFSGLSCLLS